jgi:hypothetical protein
VREFFVRLRRRLGLRFPGLADFYRNLLWLFQSDKSQHGESKLLQAHLPRTGSFLEIGAFQPVLLSNSWELHKRGWRGLSVEANSSLRIQWRTFRPRSPVIWSAVLPHDTGPVTFYQLDAGTAGMSSVSWRHANEHAERFNSQVSATPIDSISIEALLLQFKTQYGCCPTLLMTDVEGLDSELLSVLACRIRSDLRPDFVLAELLPGTSAPMEFLRHYRPIGQAGPSILFVTISNAATHLRPE